MATLPSDTSPDPHDLHLMVDRLFTVAELLINPVPIDQSEEPPISLQKSSNSSDDV